LTVSFSTSKRKTSSADYIWALTSYLPDRLRTPNSLYSNLLQPLNDIIRRQKQTAVQIEQSPKRNLIFKHYHMNSWRFWLRVFPVSSWHFHNWLPDIMRQRLCSSQTESRQHVQHGPCGQCQRRPLLAWFHLPIQIPTHHGDPPGIHAQLGLHL